MWLKLSQCAGCMDLLVVHKFHFQCIFGYKKLKSERTVWRNSSRACEVWQRVEEQCWTPPETRVPTVRRDAVQCTSSVFSVCSRSVRSGHGTWDLLKSLAGSRPCAAGCRENINTWTIVQWDAEWTNLAAALRRTEIMNTHDRMARRAAGQDTDKVHSNKLHGNYFQLAQNWEAAHWRTVEWMGADHTVRESSR
jgi:hypothetical protein